MKNRRIKHRRILEFSNDKVFRATFLKIIIPVGLAFILFVLSVFLLFIPFMEAQQMAQKRRLIRDLTNSAWSLLAQYEAEVQAGDLSLKEARKKAMNRVRKLRYGPEGKDYFWISDMQSKLVMHPYRTDLEGQALPDFTDSNGTRLLVAFSDTVKNHTAGYVDYAWQWKDDPGRIAPKISYVRGFKPWGWIVGAGIYVDDVREDMASFSRRVMFVSAVILVLALLLVLYIIFESIKTERKRMEADKKLLENDKKLLGLYNESSKALEIYRSFLHSSADAIVLYNMEGKAQYINRAFTEIFGWTKGEVLDKRVPFLPESEKEKSIAIISDVLANGTPFHNLNCKRLTKDGRLLDVSISASRFETHKGEAAGLFMILRDNSERKALEAKFHEVQKMESVGTLAGGIAHDFNNLLMAIQGNVSIILLNRSLDDGESERIKNIERYVQKGAHLTNQLLGFARGGEV